MTYCGSAKKLLQRCNKPMAAVWLRDPSKAGAGSHGPSRRETGSRMTVKTSASRIAFQLLTCGAKLASIANLLMFALLLTTGGCATLKEDVPRAPSHAIIDGDRTTLGQVSSAQAAQHPGLSGFQVIASGHSAFVARAALADAAERTLDLGPALAAAQHRGLDRHRQPRIGR